MDYKTTISIIAVVLLIIALIFIAIALNTAKKNVQWPPTRADCPDFWDKHNPRWNRGRPICHNPKNIGKCGKWKQFNGEQWQGPYGDCRKKIWTTKCGLTWDGLTNNEDICNNVQTS